MIAKRSLEVGDRVVYLSRADLGVVSVLPIKGIIEAIESCEDYIEYTIKPEFPIPGIGKTEKLKVYGKPNYALFEITELNIELHRHLQPDISRSKLLWLAAHEMMKLAQDIFRLSSPFLGAGNNPALIPTMIGSMFLALDAIAYSLGFRMQDCIKDCFNERAKTYGLPKRM